MGKKLLIIVVFAIWGGTALWFVPNVLLNTYTYVTPDDVGLLTSIVQVGFVLGSLLTTYLQLIDRFSAKKVFLYSVIIASSLNLLLLFDLPLYPLAFIRLLVGILLAGIYPVGIALIAERSEKSIGNDLGYLVGALALGTAFPHFLEFANIGVTRRFTVFGVSLLAYSGALCVALFVPSVHVKHEITKKTTFNFHDIQSLFSNKEYKSAVLGYVAHMWELYTFWVFTPIIVKYYFVNYDKKEVSILSFSIIALGVLGSILSGKLSNKIGHYKVAYLNLSISSLLCIFSPIIFYIQSDVLFIIYMLFWGAFVVGDSAQFSSLVSLNSPKHQRGTAIILYSCIGFVTTVLSISFTQFLIGEIGVEYSFVQLCTISLFYFIFVFYNQKQKSK